MPRPTFVSEIWKKLNPMHVRNRISLFFVTSILLASCTNTDLTTTLDEELKTLMEDASPTGDVSYYVLPQSDDYQNLPNQDPRNPITAKKVELGKMLFFETALAQKALNSVCMETYSCSSCHIPQKGFLPGRFQGIADGGEGFGNLGSNRTMVNGYAEKDLDAQGNRPLSVMNVAYVTNTLWSGLFGANDLNVGTQASWTGLAEVNKTGYYGLEAQNIEGFNLHRLDINDKVLYEYGYEQMFDEAFPTVAKVVRYSPTTASFAMGAYLRTILTNRAPFQAYLKGNKEALTEQQKEGASLFFGKANCVKCHSSPSFSAMDFYSLGTQDMYEIGGLNTSEDDPRIRGRGMFTGAESDMFKFKVPQLYNLRAYVTFFHGSSKTSIEDVVEFKNRAKSENKFVSDDEVPLKELNLTQAEKLALVDFLRNALYDPEMDRYMPSSVLSGLCFPNNDAKSAFDLHCR